MNRLLSILYVFTLVSCSYNPIDTEIEKALQDLDSILDIKDEIAKRKESRIDSLRISLINAEDLEQKYICSNLLFDEYLKWNVDSALHYGHIKEAYALEMNNPEHMNDSYLDLAERYMISGMCQDALKTINLVNKSAISDNDFLTRYYQTHYNIYSTLSKTCKDRLIGREYDIRKTMYMDLCKGSVIPGCPVYYSILGRINIEGNSIEEKKELLLHRLAQEDISLHEMAELHYRLANIYSAEGNEARTLIHHAKSALFDLKSGIREYRSLIQTAQLLYKRGDIRRAYSYIMTSYNDAMISDARVSLGMIGNSLIEIISRYEHINTEQERKLRASVFVLVVFTLFISIALMLLNRNRKRLHKAKVEIEEQTKKLRESNMIKDSCMGEFLSLFSEHTNSLERYRSKLRKTAKQLDFNILQQELRSDDFIDEEAKFFYDRFDKFFLTLFPDFIEQFNALLLPEKRIGERLPKGRLTNELRIFALMRLGVTDPSRVAKFLKKSPQTIYNYRVKLHNAATCDRDRFEELVMNIC